MIGKTLDGKYEILRAIGEGGMGAVYEAVHVGVGRRVAVKVISTEHVAQKETQIARFQREAKLAGGIETRHICQVLDTGADADGRPYMVMELMRGRDVAEVLKEHGPLPPNTALAILVQACRGLQKAHEAGIVHRDIKPANLFLCDEEDGDVTVKVLDFGIAKIRGDLVPSEGSDPTLTRTGALMGSPLYMSPEQARGKHDIDARSDVYSLGVVLYRMLCGRAPYQHIDAFGDLLMSICTGPVPSLQSFAPWVEPKIAEIAHRALRTHRDDRFQSAAEMLAAAEALLPSGFRLRREHVRPLDAETRAFVAQPAAAVSDDRAMTATQNGVTNTRDDSVQTARATNSGRAGIFLGIAAGFFAAVGAYAFTWNSRAVHDEPTPAATAEATTRSTEAAPPSSVAPAATDPSAEAMASAAQSASAAPTSSTPVVPGPLPKVPFGTLPKPTGSGTVKPIGKPAGSDDDDKFGGRK